jgi:hypothetical protein
LAKPAKMAVERRILRKSLGGNERGAESAADAPPHGHDWPGCVLIHALPWQDPRPVSRGDIGDLLLHSANGSKAYYIPLIGSTNPGRESNGDGPTV